MKLSEIQQLIKFVSKSGISEVQIEDKDFKINIKTPPYNRRGKKGEELMQPHVVTQMMPQQMPMQQQMPTQQMPAQQMPGQQTPAQQEASKAEETEKAKKEEESKYIEIKSPMIGTFYRRPSPDKPEFVKVGDNVSEGDHVCVIEAMKLFNEIESEVSGKIVKVLVDDNTPVEYDQPLFLVDPA